MKQFTIQKAGVALALLLGVGLLIAKGSSLAATPLANGPAVLKTIQLKQDHVEPLDLAKSIIEGKKDSVLVDIRQPWEFDDYHIPGAINVPIDQLLGDRGRASLPKDKPIVLYSGGGAHAAQAWVVLLEEGYDVKTLLDGLQGWWRDVMTPTSLKITDEAKDEQEYKAMKSVRKYFQGGSAPSGKPVVPETSAPTPNEPGPSSPAVPSEPSKPAPGKAKGGGC